MTIKLRKAKEGAWLGNGLGNSNAEWVVKGAEYIHLFKGSFDWTIRNDSTGTVLARNIPTRTEALDRIERLLADNKI